MNPTMNAVSPSGAPSIAVLCGGVGAARFLGALLPLVNPTDVTAIVNTADDALINGLWISPDLDTIVYTTTGAIDPERGWGLAGETWRAMESLRRYEAVRPDGSNAATTWFNLGDADLATHLYRTTRLNEGASLTAITAEIASAWGIEFEILPMTDQQVSTKIAVRDADQREISFQDYFVRLRHDVDVAGVRFEPDGVPPSAAVVAALETADVIVVAPSNPVVSIGPIRSLDGVDDILRRRRDQVVAISPIIGGHALKGPADRLLTAMGADASVVGVARWYRDIIGHLVIDPCDESLVEAVAETGVRPVVQSSVMSDPHVAAALAQATINAVYR